MSLLFQKEIILLHASQIQELIITVSGPVLLGPCALHQLYLPYSGRSCTLILRGGKSTHILYLSINTDTV